MKQKSLEEKIKKIKDKIADCRDYINSDFCKRCQETYEEIKILEQELLDLENECT